VSWPRVGVGCVIRRDSELLLVRRRFVGVTNDLFADDEKHYVTLWFEAEYAGGEPRALASDEVSEVAWFQEDRLPEPLFLSLESLFAGRTLP
jgi:8-oxo-dGTP diphosphatase